MSEHESAERVTAPVSADDAEPPARSGMKRRREPEDDREDMQLRVLAAAPSLASYRKDKRGRRGGFIVTSDEYMDALADVVSVAAAVAEDVPELEGHVHLTAPGRALQAAKISELESDEEVLGPSDVERMLASSRARSSSSSASSTSSSSSSASTPSSSSASSTSSSSSSASSSSSSNADSATDEDPSSSSAGDDDGDL